VIYETGVQQMKNAMMETSSMAILNELETYDPSCIVVVELNPLTGVSLPGARSRVATETSRVVLSWTFSISIASSLPSSNARLVSSCFYCALILSRAQDSPWEALDNTLYAIQKTFRAPGSGTYICPEVLKTFTSIAIPRQSVYKLGGPEAVARVHAGPDSMASDGRGHDIITMDSFTVENQPPLDLLKKQIVYGEFNEFRDMKRGGDYSGHYDQHRHIGALVLFFFFPKLILIFFPSSHLRH